MKGKRRKNGNKSKCGCFYAIFTARLRLQTACYFLPSVAQYLEGVIMIILTGDSEENLLPKLTIRTT